MTVTGPVRIAVAGAGLIGRRHLEEIDAGSTAQIEAVVDPSTPVREVAEKFGVPLFASLAELFARGSPDGVILFSSAKTAVISMLWA